MEADPKDVQLELTEGEEVELTPVVPIRTETTLTRYPLHRIAKKTQVKIKQTKRNERGRVETTWEVRNPPGPLAYKLDTIIINRRIDEMRNRGEIKQLFAIGSLADICRELGINPSGKNTNSVKESLTENVGALINCKLFFTAVGGTKRSFEFKTTRYTVILTGEEFPDGTKADQVYIELHPRYHEMLKHSETRPLDYEYLKSLKPSSQRLYELLSFPMYGTLKHGRKNTRMFYSDFCKSAPLTRYEDSRKMHSQMWKIHQPHIEAGYIKAIDFEEVADAEGRPDWIIRYTPGKKARHEFKEFLNKEIAEPRKPRLLEAKKQETLFPVPQASKLSSHQESLQASLMAYKVKEETARLLVEKYPDRVAAQLEALPYRKGVEDEASFLIAAIGGDYSLPAKLETKKTKEAATKKAEADKASREQFEREYFDYLREELKTLPTQKPEASKVFDEDFESLWKTACRDLSDNKREMMRLHHFEQFVTESSGLNTLTFKEWIKKRTAASKKA